MNHPVRNRMKWGMPLFLITVVLWYASWRVSNPRRNIVTVVLTSNGQTTVQHIPASQVQVSANFMHYNAFTKTLVFEGRGIMTIHRQGFTPLRLTSERGSVQAWDIEEQIDAGGCVETDPVAPIRELSAHLQPDGEVLTYRLTWYFSVFQYQSQGTAIYNPQNKTLKEEIYEGDENGRGYFKNIYTGVTDTILRKFEKDYAVQFSTGTGTMPFHFDQLTQYGCTKRKSST